jgi:hypothetical protein
VDYVVQGSPAETCGLQVGDMIIRFEHVTSSIIDVGTFVSENIGQPLKVKVRR